MSDVMMNALQAQVQSLTRQVKTLTPENERMRKLLTEFDERHDRDQARIRELERELYEAYVRGYHDCQQKGITEGRLVLVDGLELLAAKIKANDLLRAGDLVLAQSDDLDEAAIPALADLRRAIAKAKREQADAQSDYEHRIRELETQIVRLGDMYHKRGNDLAEARHKIKQMEKQK